MRDFVHRPTLEKLTYVRSEVATFSSGNVLLPKLHGLPMEKQKEAMVKLHNKTHYLAEELGWWAASSFVSDLVNALQSKIDLQALPGEVPSRDTKNSMLACLRPFGHMCEQRHAAIAQKHGTSTHVSAKFRCLINRLQKLLEDRGDSFHGIIFVRQRVATVMLQKLLQTESCTSDQLRCGSFVGESNSCSYDTDLSELVVPRTQRDVLKQFKGREKNLIVTTDALDEGIDVAACNSIICFDPPQNLRSFIQKRGRARERDSTYVIMAAHDATGLSPRHFEDAESFMSKIVVSENEKISRACTKESMTEEVDYRLTSPIG